MDSMHTSKLLLGHHYHLNIFQSAQSEIYFCKYYVKAIHIELTMMVASSDLHNIIKQSATKDWDSSLLRSVRAKAGNISNSP